MKTATIAGILLIVIGIISLAYQGIHYTTQKKVLDLGSVEATKTEHHNVPLPPFVGGVCLVGGIILLVVGARESSAGN